jgi:protein TonB
MRRVYQRPAESKSPAALALGLGLGLLVFGILPFTTALSTARSKQMLLSRVDVASPPPLVVEAPPPQPEPEKEKEEPPPKLAETPRPLNLAANLDLAVGTGGALASAPGFLTGAVEETGLNAFHVSDLDKPPELVSAVQPGYPAEMRKAGTDGSVTLLFVLDEEGRVNDPRVDASSHPAFEQPALEALKKWRFRPGTKEGQPVKTYMRLPMRFRVG